MTIPRGRQIDDAVITDCATKFVDELIMRAIEIIESDYPTENTALVGREMRNLEDDPDDEWPTSNKMTVRIGLKCLKKMMKSWKLEPAMRGWKFYAEFIGLDTDGSSDIYSYQVKWSYPTFAYPEPQVIVNVFFTVEATLLKYPNYPVDVKYVFEGNKFAHRLKMTFRPKWIYDVLDIKTIMFKSFKF